MRQRSYWRTWAFAFAFFLALQLILGVPLYAAGTFAEALRWIGAMVAIAIAAATLIIIGERNSR